MFIELDIPIMLYLDRSGSSVSETVLVDVVDGGGAGLGDSFDGADETLDEANVDIISNGGELSTVNGEIDDAGTAFNDFHIALGQNDFLHPLEFGFISGASDTDVVKFLDHSVPLGEDGGGVLGDLVDLEEELNVFEDSFGAGGGDV